MNTNRYYFQTTVTRVNLALVIQALRQAGAPKEEIEADIKSLISGNIAQGKIRAVDLLLRHNLAYYNYAKNCVQSHDGAICFANIHWAVKSLQRRI